MHCGAKDMRISIRSVAGLAVGGGDGLASGRRVIDIERLLPYGSSPSSSPSPSGAFLMACATNAKSVCRSPRWRER